MMFSRFRTTILASLTGAVTVYTTSRRERSTCYADTAFERHYDVRDFHSIPAYHLVNNFWLPQNGPQPTIAFHGGFVNPTGPEPERNDDGDFDLVDLSSPAAALGTSLFHHGYFRKISLPEAIKRSRKLLEIHREEIGSPGFVVGVSVDGHVVWSEGMGYADFENRVPCHADTVMRIASIGKAISMALIAKLWEQGLLELDKPIQEYLPDFPLKSYDGQLVTITCRQLVSHLSGIRHYSKTKKPENNGDSKPSQTADLKAANPKGISKPVSVNAKYNEFEEPEYYLKDFFKTTADSVALFQNDPLLGKPGETFLYTTHGWTLLCAVVEAVTKRKLIDVLKDALRDLDMTNTFLDEYEPIVHNRSRNYQRDKNGRLKNAPYVDNSYKYAGGGLLSTVGDLLKFAHLMLYAYRQREHQPRGYLSAATMQTMWTLVEQTKKTQYSDNGYGMGWMIFPARLVGSWCLRQPHVAYHTGGAIGASSVLTILPRNGRLDDSAVDQSPQGIVVTIIANLEQAALYKKSVEIAQIFDQVDRRTCS